MSVKSKVYIDGRLVGFHPNPEKLSKDLVNSRRENKIDPQINVALNDKTKEVYINTDSGRVQRPLIVAKNGKTTLTEEILQKIEKKELKWQDLVEKGIIEYLDAEEEENALIAEEEKELTAGHTHIEINPLTMLSVISSFIPYLNHNMAGKALHGAKMFKQAAGLGQINYNLRTDTEGYLLHYPQKSLVKTKTMDMINLDRRPQIQNFVVAIMPYYGFNTLDAVIINEAALQRSMGRMAYFRTYEASQKRYPGGQKDAFEIPDEETVGFLGDETYAALGEDGFAEIGAKVKEKSAVIGRTSPPRFLEEVSDFGVVDEKKRDASVSVRKEKGGYVDRVLITEDTNGSKLVKVKIRSDMKPEVGDKFSSRHGQKGVVGLIVPEEDMPFTSQGVKPDLLLNPHSIPSRMTMGHLLEMLAGKAASFKGEQIDSTPFNSTSMEELEKMLEKRNVNKTGREIFYDGITGEKIQGEVFTGVVAYRRLYHMVAHKMQARSRGPVQILTRQPTEGKEKEGGLRFGEMEGETLVGHGAAMLLQEKLVEDSDKSVQFVSEKSGLIAMNDRIRNRKYCPVGGSGKIYPVEMGHSFKLLLDELKALGIYPRLVLKDKA